LVAPKSKRKRNKAVVALLLPALIFIAIIGWAMYWIGGQKKPNKIQCKPVEKDNVSITPIVYEENQEITNA